MSEEQSELHSEFNAALGYLAELTELMKLCDDYFITLAEPYLPLHQKLSKFDAMKATVRLIAMKIKYFSAEQEEIEKRRKELLKKEEDMAQKCESGAMSPSLKNSSIGVEDINRYTELVAFYLPQRVEGFFEFYDYLHKVGAKAGLWLPTPEVLEKLGDMLSIPTEIKANNEQQ